MASVVVRLVLRVASARGYGDMPRFDAVSGTVMRVTVGVICLDERLKISEPEDPIKEMDKVNERGKLVPKWQRLKVMSAELSAQYRN